MFKIIAGWLRNQKIAEQEREIVRLKLVIDSLEKTLKEANEEVEVLWFRLDEIKAEEEAMTLRLQEEIADALLKSAEPIGNA